MPIRDDEKFLKYFLSDDEKEAEAVYIAFNTTMDYLAGKASMLTGMDKDDLKSEATIGLARAKRDFDLDRSDNFQTFAIYHIKTAMREFITKQISNIKPPQYLKDAAMLLDRMKNIMEKEHKLPYPSISEIWMLSGKAVDVLSEQSAAEIQLIRLSLQALADRSRVSINELIDRLELLPVMSEYEDGISDVGADYDVEEHLVDAIDRQRLISNIKSMLTQDEFELLMDRLVHGMTVRELEEKRGIRAASIVTKTNKILDRIRNAKHKFRTSNAMPVKDRSFKTDSLEHKMKKSLKASDYDLVKRFIVDGESIADISSDLHVSEGSLLAELSRIADTLKNTVGGCNENNVSFTQIET